MAFYTTSHYLQLGSMACSESNQSPFTHLLGCDVLQILLHHNLPQFGLYQTLRALSFCWTGGGGKEAKTVSNACPFALNAPKNWKSEVGMGENISLSLLWFLSQLQVQQGPNPLAMPNKENLKYRNLEV